MSCSLRKVLLMRLLKQYMLTKIEVLASDACHRPALQELLVRLLTLTLGCISLYLYSCSVTYPCLVARRGFYASLHIAQSRPNAALPSTLDLVACTSQWNRGGYRANWTLFLAFFETDIFL
jgi:hypothetical protein